MNDQRRRSLLVAALLGLALLTAGAGAAAPAPNPVAARKELSALYAQFGRLLQQEHRYALKQFFLKHTAEDAVLKQDGKSFTREEMAELMEEGPMAMIQFKSFSFAITSLAVKGKDVIVLYRDKTAGILVDPQDNPHKIVSTSTNRDTWVKTDEGWKTRASEVLTSKTIVDGKEVKPKLPRAGSR